MIQNHRKFTKGVIYVDCTPEEVPRVDRPEFFFNDNIHILPMSFEQEKRSLHCFLFKIRFPVTFASFSFNFRASSILHLSGTIALLWANRLKNETKRKESNKIKRGYQMKIVFFSFFFIRIMVLG